MIQVETPSENNDNMLYCSKKLEEGLRTIANRENGSGTTTALCNLFIQLLRTLPSQNGDDCETDFMDVQDFIIKLKEFISDVQRSTCP